MSNLLSIPIDKISENDLLDLVEVKRVREHVGIDYKSISYPHSHLGAVELLSDVTAMANASGGLILIGVEEDRKAPEGTPKSLIGIDDGDVEANRIQSICLSSIDERIPGLRIRDIPLENGRHCIVIQVPNSLKKPHMVVHEKHRSFRMRHGRSNTLIGMQEVKSMILNMYSYQATLVDFLEKRIQANQVTAEGDPFLLLMATPIYVGSDKLDPIKQQYRDLLEKVPGVPDPDFDGILVGKPKPRIFGIEAVPYGQDPHGKCINYLRLFRNAHFEYYENYFRFKPDGQPIKPMAIQSYHVAITLLHFLSVFKQINELSEMSEPATITLVLGNAAPSYLQYWVRYSPWRSDDFFWNDTTLRIEVLVTEFINPNQAAAELLDLLFNAYGYDKNTHIDDNYQLQKQIIQN